MDGISAKIKEESRVPERVRGEAAEPLTPGPGDEDVPLEPLPPPSPEESRRPSFLPRRGPAVDPTDPDHSDKPATPEKIADPDGTPFLQ